MANFFEVVNPGTGGVQVNDSYMNFQVARSGILNCATQVNPQATPKKYKGTVSYTSATRPLIAVNSGVSVVTIVKTSGNTYTFDVIADSLVPVQVEYFILDSAASLAPSSFGLQVFRADGTMLFDAVQPCMKIIGTYSGDILQVGDPLRVGSVTYNFPGRKLAVVSGTLSVASYFLPTDPGGDPNSGYIQFEFGMSKTEIGSVTLTWKTPYMEIGTSGGSAGYKSTYQYKYNFLILDVTNFPVG